MNIVINIPLHPLICWGRNLHLLRGGCTLRGRGWVRTAVTEAHCSPDRFYSYLAAGTTLQSTVCLEIKLVLTDSNIKF